MLASYVPITATLCPIIEDSVGKDDTPSGFDSENLYIEGDSLEMLKLLQGNYLRKGKMVYVDMKAPRLIQYNYSNSRFVA